MKLIKDGLLKLLEIHKENFDKRVDYYEKEKYYSHDMAVIEALSDCGMIDTEEYLNLIRLYK